MINPSKKIVVGCYIDADFSGLWGHKNPQDSIFVSSRIGFLVTLNNCPLLLVSKIHTEIYSSTLHSEYVEFSYSVRDLLPLKSIIK